MPNLFFHRFSPRLLPALFILAVGSLLAQVGGETGKSTVLFNGKDLTGWEGAPGWWKVEDGAITSESTVEKPCTTCNYLVWKGGQPGDFELTCEFKISEKGNSGIQIRSEIRPNWDTYGYQADMTGDGSLVGYLYHHKRGLFAKRGEDVVISVDGKRTATTIAEEAALLRHYKPGEWNTYRIVCAGPRIELHINGVLMSRVVDHDPATAVPGGIIALQMHPGPPMKVQFRKLVLMEPAPPAP